MTSPTMVSGASKNVRKNPNTWTSIQRSPERASKKVKSTRNAEFFAASCLDNHRTCLQKEGLSTLWPTVGYVQSALRVNLEEVVWSPTRTDMIYWIFRQNYLRTDCRNNRTHRSYPEGVNVVSIIVCLKDVRDYKYESVLLDKLTIYLHIRCSSFAEDLSEGAKAPFRPEVLQFSRWWQTV